MKKAVIKNFIPNFLVWPMLFFTILLFENNKGITVNNMIGLNWIDISFVSGFIILLFFIYSYRGLFTRDGLVHTILPYLLMILFVGNFVGSLASLLQDITIVRFVGNIETTLVLDIKLKEFIQSNLFSIVGIILAMIFLSIIPRRMTHPGQMNVLFYVLFIFLFISIVYSLVSEWQLYVDALTRGIRDYVYVTKSFFLNRNLFASYLLLGIIVAVFLYAISRKYRFLVLTFPFAFAIVFTISKTKILLAYIFLIIVFLTLVIRFLKKRWWQGLLSTIIWISLIATPILLLTVPLFKNTYPGQLMDFFIKNVLVDQGERTILSRINIWKETLKSFFTTNILFDWKNINYMKVLFGQGNYISRLILGFQMPSSAPTDHYLGNFHNGFLAVFASGGLVAFIPYLGLIAYLYYVNFKILKRNRGLGFFGILSLSLFLVHSMMESITLISFNAEGIAHSIPVVLPIMSYYYYAYKQPESLKNQVRHSGQIKNFIEPEERMYPAKTMAFYLVPITTTALVLTFDVFKKSSFDLVFYIVYFVFFIFSGFTFPFIYQSIMNRNKKIIRKVLLLLGFLSFPVLGAVVSLIIFENILYGVGIGYLIGFLIYVIVKKVTLDNRFDMDDHMDAFRDVFVLFYAVTLLSLVIQIPVVVILQTQDTFMLVIKIVDILLFNFIIIYLFGLNKKEKNQIGLFLYPLNEWIKKNYRNNIEKYEMIEQKENNKKKVSA